MSRSDQVVSLLPTGADGVVLETPGVVSWYLGGARVSVPLGGPSIVAVLVHRDGDEVRCHVMEASRLQDEEGVMDATAVAWPELLIPDHWRGDPRLLSEHQLESELRAARASLTETELDRYRALGSGVAAAVTAVATQLVPDATELSVAGALADAVYSLGAEPVVVLVAGASRLGYRHPVPTPSPLGERTMLVVGARRHGLIVNLTRWVSFAPRAVDHRLLQVEAAVLDATVPGAPFTDVFATLQRAYASHGFDHNEWRNHHQGGPTGYFGRDPKVTPSSQGVVAENQAFAWNPSAPGAKVEDTVLATTAGIELLTHDPDWPRVIVAGRPRPTELPL